MSSFEGSDQRLASAAAQHYQVALLVYLPRATNVATEPLVMQRLKNVCVQVECGVNSTREREGEHEAFQCSTDVKGAALFVCFTNCSFSETHTT